MEYSGAGGKLIHEKNQKQKISWFCPFNCPSFCKELKCFKLWRLMISDLNREEEERTGETPRRPSYVGVSHRNSRHQFASYNRHLGIHTYTWAWISLVTWEVVSSPPCRRVAHASLWGCSGQPSRSCAPPLVTSTGPRTRVEQKLFSSHTRWNKNSSRFQTGWSIKK